MNRRVFIDNFSSLTTRESLEALFKPSGKVTSVEMAEVNGRQPSSHAFVLMSTDQEASQAIRTLNNREWNGLRLTVTRARPVSLHLGFSGGHTESERKNR